MQLLVSIIMPVFNGGRFVEQAVDSVLRQSFSAWELLIIDDGSTDGTHTILSKYSDKRIHVLKQENRGVAAARNKGLSLMRGNYFCFLDADDVLTQESLSSRVKALEENPAWSFVDGTVHRMNSELSKVISVWQPSFSGNGLKALVRLNGAVFFGPTWMIRVEPDKRFMFKEGLKHGEDLLFFMELSRGGKLYGYIPETILYYRDTPQSAMKNLDGLEKGYRSVGREISLWNEINWVDLVIFHIRWRKFMMLDYLRKCQITKAIALLN